MYCTANKNENEIIHSVNLTNQNRNHIQLYSAIIFYHVQPVLAPLGTSVQTLWPCPPKEEADLIFTWLDWFLNSSSCFMIHIVFEHKKKLWNEQDFVENKTEIMHSKFPCFLKIWSVFLGMSFYALA